MSEIKSNKEHNQDSWIKIEEGFVEVSVFETGVPPRFRLYFFDLNGNPAPIRASKDIRIETIRYDGKKQIFAFTACDYYMEATSELPEPHEFEMILTISQSDLIQTYSTKFTEDHLHSHSHELHSGILSWINKKLGHSHHIADKVDTAMESNERGIHTLKITLVILTITALFQLGIVILSGSVALLADTIHNFADATTSLPLWVAFSLARQGTNRRFTYGYGKVEDVAGVLIVLIIFFSACIAAYESILKIINPIPMENLLLVSIASIIGFIGNEWVAMYRIRVGKEIGSAALVADGYHARVDGFTSLAVLLGVIGVKFGFPIVDPLVGIGITLAILFIMKKAAVSVWIRLIDGIEPDILAQIEHAPTHILGVSGVHNVRARWIGHRVHTDVEIFVNPNLTVQEADNIAKRVEQSLRDHIQLLGNAVVKVRPLEKENN